MFYNIAKNKIIESNIIKEVDALGNFNDAFDLDLDKVLQVTYIINLFLDIIIWIV